MLDKLTEISLHATASESHQAVAQPKLFTVLATSKPNGAIVKEEADGPKEDGTGSGEESVDV